MSEQSATPERPPQVTVAAWMIIVGSVFVVLMVWDRIAGLHTLQSRHALQSVVDDPHYRQLGLTLGGLEATVKVVSMIGAGCATAMVILGWHALQRSRSARLALTVLAGPLFLCGLVTGGFVSAGVAAAVATLWWGQARLWFDGRSAPQTPRVAHPSTRPVPPHSPSHGPTGGTVSGPHPPPTQDPPTQDQPTRYPPTYPPTSPLPWSPPPVSAYDARPAAVGVLRGRRGARPASVQWACLVTWLFTATAALLLAASIVVLATSSRTVLDKMREQNPQLASQGISDHLILVLCYVLCAAFLLWSVGAAVLAALVFRGVSWAWYVLIVSTVCAGGVCLLGALGSLLLLAPLVGTGVTIGLLVGPRSRAWFGR